MPNRVASALYDWAYAIIGEAVPIIQAFGDNTPELPYLAIGVAVETDDGPAGQHIETIAGETTVTSESTTSARVQLYEVGGTGGLLRKLLDSVEYPTVLEILRGYGVSILSTEAITPLPRSQDNHYVYEATSFVNLSLGYRTDITDQVSFINTTVTTRSPETGDSQ